MSLVKFFFGIPQSLDLEDLGSFDEDRIALPSLIFIYLIITEVRSPKHKPGEVTGATAEPLKAFLNSEI
jgi:hypothetical protein